ncbi:ATP-binding cassette domain-containing protein [Streptomyces sp. NPDC059525]|uniref:ATP-binding cassette domain-containing protein n=1 Tax=Streptomyces sp. NPDC059525 TaxID=3346857 RepID=UPI0036C5F0CF
MTGGNGAGKTTLLRTMVGELAPDEGAVHRDGEVGYCPQETVVNPLLSVSQHLELFRTAHGLPDTGHAQDLLGALGCPDAMEQQVGTLSGGTRQKLNLVLALMNRPTLLVLDEPYQDTHRRFWHLARRFRAGRRAPGAGQREQGERRLAYEVLPGAAPLVLRNESYGSL